ncbi:hypothetical protein MNB_SM-4-1334 [hydrothermal vent metagenome]|uniref:HD domain-containing protein n=1 Tax=hydrothermal vent metagenome TaxID=652676 RepID=A0A1W1CL14_9ZZZZ
MIGAGLLHDVGKPFTAFKKDEEDYDFNEWSFTDHEERSYQIIKNWPFIIILFVILKNLKIMIQKDILKKLLFGIP